MLCVSRVWWHQSEQACDSALPALNRSLQSTYLYFISTPDHMQGIPEEENKTQQGDPSNLILLIVPYHQNTKLPNRLILQTLDTSLMQDIQPGLFEFTHHYSVSRSSIKFPGIRNYHFQPSQALEMRLGLYRKARSELGLGSQLSIDVRLRSKELWCCLIKCSTEISVLMK